MSDIHESLRKIASDHGVPDYYVWSFGYFLESADFSGKRVLEVGGSSLPREFISALGAKEWISVDILGHSAGAYQQDKFVEHYRQVPTMGLSNMRGALGQLDYCICDGDASLIPPEVMNYFDVIVSVNAFEHVLDFPGLIETLKRVLVPGGRLLSSFGPIWSCANGSHFWVSNEWNFDSPGPLGPHAHLLLDPSECYAELLRAGVAGVDAREAVMQIYMSSRINRLAFDDYRRYLECSGLDIIYFKAHYKIEVPDERYSLLVNRFPSRTDFSTYSAVLSCSRANDESA